MRPEAQVRRSRERLRLAYLAWVYPEISQTFVQREVAALRRLGTEVHTTSIRPPAADQLVGPAERRTAAETWTLLPVAPRVLVLAHLRALLRSPSAYVSALTAALRGRHRLNGLRELVSPFLYFAEAVLLSEHLRAREVEHLHAHFGDVGCEVARLVAHLQRAGGRPFTWSFTLHGPGELLDPGGFRLARKVEDADLVVAITEYCRSQLIALVGPEHWDKIKVVHCGVELDGWPRRPPGAVGTPFRLLTVGRLHPQKSHHVLLEAVGLLRDRGVDVVLTLVGEGETRPRLEAEVRRLRLQDRVRLVGARGQDEVRTLFSESDAFCLASVSEGLPVVLMEAMASGLPLVTTRITGVPELVEDGRSGLLVPPAEPVALADAVQRLVQEPGLRERLVAAGLQTVRDGFSSKANAALLADHIRSVRAAATRPAA